MKIIAYNLPQFHEIPENDLWWGKGYTEWTALNRENPWGDKIRPLHGQYNMLDKSTMEMQYKISSEHGLFGFCYYHYWFKGKKLLETPIENLLKWNDIPQNFCFCWANHSWYKAKDGGKELLIEQTYGNEKDWKEHFNYLKKFFLDERYIKIDNKPVLNIYANFPEREQMILMFNLWCEEIGFDGLYFIATTNSKALKHPGKADAIVLREPITDKKFNNKIMNLFRRIQKKVFIYKKQTLSPRVVSGAKIRKLSLRFLKNYKFNGTVYPCAFSMWNNTYRHKNKGYIIPAPTKSEFISYLSEIKKICSNKGIEFCFFNAWNEWAEGMILEPDTIHEYLFLESIKSVLSS